MDTSKEPAEFWQIEHARQEEAAQHDWAMFMRFKTTDYTRWYTRHIYENGTTNLVFEEPRPRGSCYDRVFFGRVLNGVAHGVIPYLEFVFYKDEPDLSYVEGLLLQAEEIGLQHEGTVYLMSGEGINTLYTDLSFEQREVVQGFSNSAKFIGGTAAANRLKLVRKWVRSVRKQKRKALDSGLAQVQPPTRTLTAYQPEAQQSSWTTSVLPELSLRQVALLHIYQEITIPKSGADAIAQQHRHNSGSKLYEHYRKLIQLTNRLGVEGRAIAPLLADIAAVIPHLSGTAKQQAEGEYQTLELRK